MTAGAEPRHRVAIIGAGFSGLGLAIALVRRGTHDFVVFERADDVGGTWRDNTYPGAACDVPSNLYSYSFAPNPSWSRSFSPQREIQAYLRACAERYAVLDHVRFSHDVTFAAWDDVDSCWELHTTGGHFRADVLVSARGPLSEPALPRLKGLDRFGGTLFHSARWDHGHDLSGERVAVIGTGASTIQFVPEIQPVAGRLHVFQRTPPWVIPRRERRFTGIEHALFRALPAAQLAARAAVYWAREAFVLGFVGTPARRQRRARVAAAAGRRLLESQVSDAALREKLTPRYEMGCKRILLSNEYYPALTRENVELVTDPITEIRRHAIVTADGNERPIDTIVLGTGFDVRAQAAATRTVGRGGRTLADAWAPRLAAYKGMTVAGFPNLFFMVGPNSGLGHTSIVFIIESQITYVLGALDTMATRGVASIEVSEASQRRWIARIEAQSANTVWTAGGCRSYYLDDAGRNVTIWPGTSWSYRSATRRFDVSAYVTRRAAPSRGGDRAGNGSGGDLPPVPPDDRAAATERAATEGAATEGAAAILRARPIDPVVTR
ncbi:MAG: flavin-containing monooxygenase [Acidimicrobiales bacterium]